MNIKAVVFDFGKVLCFPPSEENRKALLALTGLPKDTLEELDRKRRAEYDRGALDGKAYYRALLAEGGIVVEDPVLDKIAETDSEGWKRIDPGALALTRDIQGAGLTLGILSNMPHDFLAWARSHVPVLTQADVAVFSCEVRSVKPERRIYEILRARLGCEFAEIAFFDDMPVNVETAAELGIRAFLWRGSEEARAELRRSGGALAAL